MTEWENTEFKATCTWGDGPDVILSVRATKPFGGMVNLTEVKLLKKWTHGISPKGSFTLTAKQAIDLSRQLEEAARSALDLEDQMIAYFNEEEKRKKGN